MPLSHFCDDPNMDNQNRVGLVTASLLYSVRSLITVARRLLGTLRGAHSHLVKIAELRRVSEQCYFGVAVLM